MGSTLSSVSIGGLVCKIFEENISVMNFMILSIESRNMMDLISFGMHVC